MCVCVLCVYACVLVIQLLCFCSRYCCFCCHVSFAKPRSGTRMPLACLPKCSQRAQRKCPLAPHLVCCMLPLLRPVSCRTASSPTNLPPPFVLGHPCCLLMHVAGSALREVGDAFQTVTEAQHNFVCQWGQGCEGKDTTCRSQFTPRCTHINTHTHAHAHTHDCRMLRLSRTLLSH